jgi:dipeptide/tripeptide permease
MRALLVLYMVGALKLGEVYGAGLYADCYGLIELGGVLGALAADQLMGTRRALLLGSLLMSVGYFLLATALHQFFGFSLVIVGLSLFTPNLLAHLSARGKNPTNTGLLSTVILILSAGTYFATPLCALLSEGQAWVWSFWVACIGTSVTTFALCFFNVFAVEETKASRKNALTLALLILSIFAVLFGVRKQSISLPLLPWCELMVFVALLWTLWKGRLLGLAQMALVGLYLVALILFYGFEEHLTALTSTRAGGSYFGGLVLGSTLLVTLNPLLVFSLEGPIDRFWRHFDRPFFKLCLSFCIGAFAFGLLSLGSSFFLSAGGISFMSVGEVLMGSMVYWFCLNLAPKESNSHAQVKFFCLLSLLFSLAVSFGTKTGKTLSHASSPLLALLLLGVGLALAGTVYLVQRKASI